jgi:hypothetical protein
VGTQAIWIFVTWLFWVIGAGIVNKTVLALVDDKVCASVAYCTQIRGLFGALSLPSLACVLFFLFVSIDAQIYFFGLKTKRLLGCVVPAVAVLER